MTKKAVATLLPVLFFLSLTGTATAQYVFTTPTPTPTPRPRPSPPAAAPNPGPAPCPTVAVQAVPGQPVRDGQRVNFVANINGGDPKVVPTIVWNTSAGSVTQGNNTRRIEVDTTGAGSTNEREVRADVWVGGYAPECLLQASGVARIIAPAAKFGEFGVVDDKTFKTNVDALASFMSQSPDYLYVIAYAGKSSERGFAYNWLKRIREALITAGVAPTRVRAMDGGFREEPLFDFWTVPPGSEPPRPTPTVKRNEIVYPRTPPTKRP